MKVNMLLLPALLGAAGLALSGCVVTGSVHERERVVVREPPPPPPPGYVVVQPPSAGYVVVQEEPARLVYEAPPRHPGGDFVWVPSYYERRGDRWVIVSGHYDHPPRAGALWVAPRYEHQGAEIRFYAGGWR